MLHSLRVFLFSVFYIIFYSSATAQVSKNDLRPLLSASDQKNLDKTETLINKGRSVAEEAEQLKGGTNDKEIAKNEKKYTLKRLEASQYFQKANSQFSSLLKENINTFRKKNKNLSLDQNVLNKEGHAGELLKQARSIRGVAEDLTYPDEKLSKILEAENIEKEANDILVKVLYAYLNRPLSYDELKFQPVPDSAGDSVVIGEVQKQQPVPSGPEKNPDQGTPDSIASTIPRHDESMKNDTGGEHEVTISGKLDLKDTSSLYGMVNVNEEQLDKFNKFLQVSYPDTYENYIIDFRNLNYRDLESLKEAWHHYLYPGTDAIVLKKQASVKDSLQHYASSDSHHFTETGATLQSEIKKDSLAENAGTIALTNTGEAKRNKTGKLIQQKPSKDQKQPQHGVEAIPAILLQESSEDINPMISKGFLYRVQITACRIPLDSASLRSVYNGSFPVLKLREDDWYKYAVGEFDTYKEARQLKEKIRVPGAFVIAYLNGKRISIPKSDDLFPAASAGNSGITYKVQIIAAKKQLGREYIGQVYAGKKNVEEVYEDGWYKYGIVIGASLDEAKNFISRENIPGAFITSYLGDKKVDLKDAIRLDKSKPIK